jgi:hypothetical protein
LYDRESLSNNAETISASLASDVSEHTGHAYARARAGLPLNKFGFALKVSSSQIFSRNAICK